MHEIFGGELAKFHVIFEQFMARDSAETSAEASVDLAEASVSAESHFRAIRSFTTGTYHGNKLMNHLDVIMLSKPNIEISVSST